jgi:hypothetical protein
VHITPPQVADAEALTDLHLDVWEEAYADLLPAPVFADRRARRDQRITSWRGIIAAGSSDNLLAWSTDGRLLGFSSTGSGRDDPTEGLPQLELMARMARVGVRHQGRARAVRGRHRRGTGLPLGPRRQRAGDPLLRTAGLPPRRSDQARGRRAGAADGAASVAVTGDLASSHLR